MKAPVKTTPEHVCARLKASHVSGFFTVASSLLVLLASAPPLCASVLDWDNVTWAAGSLTNSYNVIGSAANDITITITPIGNIT